jgi:hypothetical protein
VTDAPNLYQKARSDVCGMLGYDLDNLSAEQSVRVDVGSALRVLLDNQSSRLVKGESLDARELLMASDALSRLLPPLREPPSEPREDPREVMWRIYKTMRERGEITLKPEAALHLRIDELGGENARLEAEVATLKARLAGGLPSALNGHSAGGGGTPISPPLSDIVPPSERSECDAGPRAGPDDPKPRRPGPVIDGKANASAAPAAPASRSQSWDDTPGGKAWAAWVDAGSPGGGDRWSNRNGA